MKTVCILALALIAVCSANHPPPPKPCASDSLCYHKAEGKYAYFTPEYQITPYFYSCDGKNRNRGCLVCQENLFYSQKCDACLKKYDVQQGICPPKTGGNPPDFCGSCAHRPDGTYQAPYNKNKFYSCANYVATECQTCPDNLVYSEKCNQCLEYENPAKCDQSGGGSGKPAEKCSPHFCMQRRVNGDYEVNRYYPSPTYYTCTEGTCLVRHCAPKGTVFSQNCGACVFNYYGGCNGSKH